MSPVKSKLVPLEERSNYLPGKWYTKKRIPKAVRDEVMRRDGHRCQVCHRNKSLNVAHRVPPCRGGPWAASWNLVVLCRRCTKAKNSLTPEEFMNTYYFVFDVLGIGNPLGDHPVMVKVLFTDGTIIEGKAPKDPHSTEGDFYIWPEVEDWKILIPRDKIKAVAVRPCVPKQEQIEGPEGDKQISAYLEKISS